MPRRVGEVRALFSITHTSLLSHFSCDAGHGFIGQAQELLESGLTPIVADISASRLKYRAIAGLLQIAASTPDATNNTPMQQATRYDQSASHRSSIV